MNNIRVSGRTYLWQAMASPISLQLPDHIEALGLAVSRAVARDIEETEEALSRFRPSAELVQLNERLGQWTSVSPRLYRALSASLRAHRSTDGLFDPRVLGSLEDIGYEGAPRTSGALHAGPWLMRRPRDREVRITTPIDLGGIGKGLAVRWAARLVQRMTRNYLLNAGGDLLVDGCGPDGTGWKVGIEDPADPKTMLAVLELRSRAAVCTSSIGRLHWRHGGEEVHHLIDPRTGRPGKTGLLAVTVVADDPAWAEVRSKALFLTGARHISGAAAGHKAFWVAEDGSIGCSKELSHHLIWRRDLEKASR